MNPEGKEKESYKFPKEERLHHRSLVEGLFRNGKSFYEFPFRITWRTVTQEELEKNFRYKVPDGIGQLQVMVTVPKKKRRHAVDRVLMRRRMREAYRLNRLQLQKKIEESCNIRSLAVSLVYIHNQNLPYDTIKEKMIILLEKLERKLEDVRYPSVPTI